MLEIRVAAAKTNKYAVQEGGDTVESVERPRGGLSVVIADGQGSGHAAKAIANLVTSKAITLLKEGARDGAAARATHDYLYSFRHGKVSATLTILSVDMHSKSIVISRNSHCPVIVFYNGEVRVFDDPSVPIGIHSQTKPVITELPASCGTCVVAFSDGIMHAGRAYGRQIDLIGTVRDLTSRGLDCQDLAKGVLETAMALDAGRPADDMTIAILTVGEVEQEPAIREMMIRLPVAASRALLMTEQSTGKPSSIVVVGVCGSGKTTLVGKLTALGYTAHSCAQEHSYVPYLWSLKHPDCLIYLDASLDILRQRLDISWSETYLADERKRLANARANCYIYVNTDDLDATQVLQTVLRELESSAKRERTDGELEDVD